LPRISARPTTGLSLQLVLSLLTSPINTCPLSTNHFHTYYNQSTVYNIPSKYNPSNHPSCLSPKVCPFELIKQIVRHLEPSFHEDDHCSTSIMDLACVGPHFKDAAIESLPHSTSFNDWLGTRFESFVYRALRDAKFAGAIKHLIVGDVPLWSRGGRVCTRSGVHTPWVTCPHKIVLENEGVSHESPRKRIDKLLPRLREYLHNCLDDHDALLAILLLVCKTIESLTLRLNPGNLTCGQVCTHRVWSDRRTTDCVMSYPNISWKFDLTELTVFSFG